MPPSDRRPRTRADVAIVGAGLFGTALARELARAGMRVLLVERALPGAGDSGRSFGMVRQHYSNEVTVRLARRGLRALAAHPGSGYTRTGYLLTVPEALREACARNVALGQRLGVATELLDPDGVAHIDPALRLDGVAAAAHEPDGGVVDGGRTALAWFAEALAAGADVRLGLAVEAVEEGALATAEGRLEATTVVVAAGCWSARLLPELPIELRRIDVAVVSPLRVRATVSDAVTNVVVRPGVGDAAWAVAYAGVERFGDRDEAPEAPEEAYADTVRAALAERYRGADGALPRRAWTGVYDATPDWNPVIGRVRDGVVAVAGLSGHGVKLAPAVAECLAAELAGEEPPVDLSPLRPGRFAEGEPLQLAYGPGARA